MDSSDCGRNGAVLMLIKIKEFLLVGLFIVFILFINKQTVFVEVDMETITKELSKEAGLEEMQEFSASRAKADLGINVNDYKAVAYYGHESIMECETLLIICLNDGSQGDELIERIEKQRIGLMNLFQSYAPDQYELLANSILDIKGNYVFYIVSENAEDIAQLFVDCITE